MEQKILNDCNDFKALVPDFDKRKKKYSNNSRK